MEKMLKLNLTTFLFCFFLLFLLTGASRHHHHVHRRHNHRGLGGSRPTKLFVFGDSYADTGNNNVSTGASWNVPYGITFPGKAAGRFSDGRVLTDFVAKFLGLKTPLAYRWWKRVGAQYLQNGMNFAYGGTGVFETLSTYPNMTAQIGFFNQLLNESVFTEADIQSSVALVTLSGNDYNAYIQRNGSAQGWTSFITSVVNQLTVNLKKISDSGVKKIAVAGLQPLGCLPPFTAAATGLQCNATLNALVVFHNQLLQQAVATLNNETDGSQYIILDLYTSFMGVLNSTTTAVTAKFENPLKLCCAGTSTSSSCGTVDQNGVKQYTVCDNPKSAFFWDSFHPTQAGWSTVYGTLQTTLQKLLE